MPQEIAERLLTCREPAEPTLSPDGERYAYVVATPTKPKGGRSRSAIYVGHLDRREAEEIPGDGRDLLPTWSPTGRLLAFGSDRGGAAIGLYVWDGKVRPLGTLPGDVEAIVWSHDERQLLVLVAQPGTDRAGAAGATRIGDENTDPRVYRPRQAWRRLYRVDAQTGAAEVVSQKGLNVWELSGIVDNQVLAVVSHDPSENAWYGAHLALLDLDEGTATTVHESDWQLQAPTLAEDGTTAAFVEGYMSDRGQGLGEPVLLDLTSGQATVLSLERDVQRLRFQPDGRLFYVGQDHLRTACGLLARDGTVEELFNGPATLGFTHVHDAAISADGSRVLASVQAPGRPPELSLLESGSWQPVTALNKDLGIPDPVVETTSWPTDDGTTIEGILLLPPTKTDGPLPLVVYAHGGPNNAWTLTYYAGYRGLGIALALAGYAVLFPNQRGSTGRGQAFTKAHLGDYGPMDLRDVLAGVDHLARAGRIDRDRVGIVGGSAGGFLAAWAATAGSEHFAASVPIASVSNWVSFHNTSNIPRLTEIEFGSDAYDATGNHAKLSPIMHARGSRTPTLILHGELDLCTPLGQAQELYQALTSEGGEAELVVYPREGHGFSEHEHLLDYYERIQAWFDTHLKGA
jgi:dipeptidyl aminopeptidase/acylaminoacyl peptidase